MASRNDAFAHEMVCRFGDRFRTEVLLAPFTTFRVGGPAEWLLENLGDDPETYPGKKVVLHLGEYEYNRERKLGIRLKLPQPATNGPPPQPRALPSHQQDLDDEIPF